MFNLQLDDVYAKSAEAAEQADLWLPQCDGMHVGTGRKACPVDVAAVAGSSHDTHTPREGCKSRLFIAQKLFQKTEKIAWHTPF